MPNIEPDRVKEVGEAIHTEVTAILEEANEILPELRSIDQSLYTSVHPALALNYSMGVGYMNEMVQGAMETFVSLKEGLAASADLWGESDEVAAKGFE